MWTLVPVKAALGPKGTGRLKIDMVLSEELTSAVKYDEDGVVEAVHTWNGPQPTFGPARGQFVRDRS